MLMLLLTHTGTWYQERIRNNLTMLMHILATNIAVKMVKEIIKHPMVTLKSLSLPLIRPIET